MRRGWRRSALPRTRRRRDSSCGGALRFSPCLSFWLCGGTAIPSPRIAASLPGYNSCSLSAEIAAARTTLLLLTPYAPFCCPALVLFSTTYLAVPCCWSGPLLPHCCPLPELILAGISLCKRAGGVLLRCGNGCYLDLDMRTDRAVCCVNVPFFFRILLLHWLLWVPATCLCRHAVLAACLPSPHPPCCYTFTRRPGRRAACWQLRVLFSRYWFLPPANANEERDDGLRCLPSARAYRRYRYAGRASICCLASCRLNALAARPAVPVCRNLPDGSLADRQDALASSPAALFTSAAVRVLTRGNAAGCIRC